MRARQVPLKSEPALVDMSVEHFGLASGCRHAHNLRVTTTRDVNNDLPAVVDFGRVPVNRHFGFSLLKVGRGKAEVAMALKRSFLQEEGIVHGGVLTTLADTTAVYTVFPFLKDSESMCSIEFKMNFLRPALIADGSLTAKAKVVRWGRSVALVEVDVFQARRLVAKGMFTYLVDQDRENGQ